MLSSRRIPELDGIRGVAILMVLCWHLVYLPFGQLVPARLEWTVAPGKLLWSGVDLFFVLSGFLLGGVLLDVRGTSGVFRTFYARRAFRILPAYALTSILLAILLHVTHTSPGLPWVTVATFTQNVWMAFHKQWWPLLPCTWSLAVEEQFYLLLPFVVMKLSRRALTTAALALIFVEPPLRYVMFVVTAHPLVPHVVSIFRFDTFAVGVLAAVIVREPRAVEWFRGHRRGMAACALVPAAVVMLAVAGGKDWAEGYPAMCMFGYTAFALLFGMLLLWAVTFTEGIVAGILRMGWLRWFGRISFTIYLTSQASSFAMEHMIERPGNIFSAMVARVAALMATLVFAQLSWKVMEAPLVRRGHGFRYGQSGSAMRASSAPGAT